MALTLANIETSARDHSGDNDSGNYAVATVTLDRQINRLIARWMHVSGQLRISDVSATTSGLTVTSSATTKDTSLTTIVDVLALWQTANASDTDVSALQPLERCAPYEIQEWLADYATPVNNISRYSAQRIGDQNAAAGKWRFTFQPPCGTTANYILRARLEPTALSSSGDIAPLGDDEGYGIGALAGAWIAARTGQPDSFIQSILADVPPTMQEMAEDFRRSRRPARAQSEAAA